MGKIPDTFDITNIIKGTDVFIRFEFFTIDADGVETALNLTGYTIEFNAKRQLSDTDANRVLDLDDTDSEIDATDIANGVIDFKPTAIDTAAWTFNNAFYNLLAISGGAPAIKTPLLKGRLLLSRSA